MATKTKGAPSKGGRPSSYTQEAAQEICRRIEEGETLRQICGSNGLPAWETVRRWLRERAEFRAQYACAREESADALEARIVTEMDMAVDGETAAIARVRIDALKWMAGKRAPKVYGDKINLSGSIGIRHEDALGDLE